MSKEQEANKENVDQLMIEIPKVHYERLLGDQARLSYLDGAGVDNWEGWDYARQQWYQDGMDIDYGDFMN